ncbi:IclR family transcriptional regulator [Pararhodobacter sp. CCB-MM2]|uniref:IclR family transcriptional regulator n=1 Tax=Pararhodobacter sp. CCB-MM2 TaxID=1786003 RepID=UPI0008344DD8|nr:IclR family transcriptional regulator [Pararhodobacter sp. CCB-MM2]MCA2011192.1 IclR family transcriptional regulator [Cereibacter sphaeroides]
MSGLNSLEKVLAILDLFSEDRLEWTPEQLMQELGYTRPTLYRYLKVLKDAGLLASLHGSGFTLGPRVVEMDYLLRQSDPLILCGQSQIEKLAGMIPCTALLVRWYGERILCVAAECSTPNPLSSYHRGRPMPITRGAIARSIIASLPKRQLVPFIATHRAELQAVGLGATEDEILERLRQVRKQGYTVAYGEVTPGVVGIAAPILDSSGVPLASICVTVAGNTIGSDRIEELGRAIQSSAAEISARLASPASVVPEPAAPPE